MAITAALLVGLGFKPLYAAGLCLIVNTAPVAFGAMGIPIIVAGQVTGLDAFEIGQMAGRQLPFLTIIVLFWIMAIMDGWRGIKGDLAGGAGCGWFVRHRAVPDLNFIGPELPDITASLASLVCLTLFLRRWKPVRIFRFDTETSAEAAAQPLEAPRHSVGQIARAWSPFLILTAMVTLWSIKPFKSLFAAGGPLEGWVLKIPVPGLDQLVQKMPPIVDAPLSYDAI